MKTRERSARGEPKPFSQLADGQVFKTSATSLLYMKANLEGRSVAVELYTGIVRRWTTDLTCQSIYGEWVEL